ncbi:unnamed protein product, partial [Amoebophrya sp. A25]|eukprot:GSA25T00002941001.1
MLQEGRLSYDRCCGRSRGPASSEEEKPSDLAKARALELPLGDAYWGYDYYLSSQKVESPESCSALCVESGSLCGGFTYLRGHADEEETTAQVHLEPQSIMS